MSHGFFGFVLVPHEDSRLSQLQPRTSVMFATFVTNPISQKMFPTGSCPVLAAVGAPGRSSRSALADLAIATPSLSSRAGRPTEEKPSADGPEEAWVLPATIGPRGEFSAADPGVSRMWTSRRARLRGLCFPLRPSPSPLLSVKEARGLPGTMLAGRSPRRAPRLTAPARAHGGTRGRRRRHTQPCMWSGQ